MRSARDGGKVSLCHADNPVQGTTQPTSQRLVGNHIEGGAARMAGNRQSLPNVVTCSLGTGLTSPSRRYGQSCQLATWLVAVCRRAVAISASDR
jgi:hypothetical protein